MRRQEVSFPLAFRLFLPAYLHRTIRAVFGPVGVWRKRRPADGTAFDLVPAFGDLGAQGRVQRQDGHLEPPAQQRIGNTLHTDTSLPVKNLAAKDCVLFLWVTFPQLPEAFKVIEAWGFSYRSVAFVWVKRNKRSYSWFYGLGYWTRGNAEICLLAVKGHPKRKSASVHQLIVSPIEQHSKKPDEARKKIVELMGNVPRLELFAREAKPGWAVWGNEVESTVIL